MKAHTDVLAYAKTGTAGGVKFESEDMLWTFMIANKGQHVHYHKGRRIYVNAGESENISKDKAVRKVVRLLIEKSGIDGTLAKSKIDARYHWGAVWWLGEDGKWAKVAQWKADENDMQLEGILKTCKSEFLKLME